MKTLLVVLVAILVVFSSCKKEQIAHNRFVVLGEYTFEVLDNPDEYGNINVKITNTSKKPFDILQEFNDADAEYAWNWDNKNTFPMIMMSARDYPTSKTIEIHKKSGISLLPQPFSKEIEPVKIFESASNFFSIYGGG